MPAEALTPRDRLVLAAILLLALALRLIRLDAPLWFDEIVTIDSHLRLGWGEMLRDYSMNYHYLHNLLAKASIGLFGETVWAVRLPALAFGVATVWASWLLARAVAGVRIAHVVALLLALSYHEIWFSQNARGYTGLALFSTLGMLLFLRGMAGGSQRLWLGFGLCLAAATFTHLTGAFFFAALGLIWLVQALRGRAPVGGPLIGAAFGLGITALLYLPVLPDLIRTVQAVSETSAVDEMQEYQSPLWTAAEGIRTALGKGGALNALVGTGALACALFGAAALRRRAALFAPAIAAHILLTAGLLVALGMRVWPRFFFVDIGLLMILIVVGVFWLTERIAERIARGRASALQLVAVVALVGLSSALALRNYSAPKQDLAGAHALGASDAAHGARVAAVGYVGEIFDGHYHEPWPTILDDADYRRIAAEPGALTLIVGFPGRSFRMVPALDRDRQAGLYREHWLPGTLGDGAIVLLRRN